MAKPFTEWTVLPHGKLTRVDDNILSVSGALKMPLVDFERRMTVVRLQDARLVVFSAIALDEAEMRALEQFGTLTYLVVPNERHRMDLKIWKERYPGMKVIAPAGARARVEEVAPVDATNIDFGDPSVRFVTVPGTNDTECALVVHNASGTTLVLNEVIFNVADQPGFGGWLMHLLGMTGDKPHVPPTVKLLDLHDKAAFSAQLDQWSTITDLRKIIVSHGSIITEQPAQVLRKIAQELRV